MSNLSKSLSKLLRHDIIKLKLEKHFTDDGYLPVDIVMNVHYIKRQHPTLESIIYISDNSDKQRFDLKMTDNKYYIRANQGHSTEVSKLLNPDKFLTRIYTYLNPPENNCIHGTFTENIKSIMEHGLSKMSRGYIHFASSMNAKSGIRKGYSKPDILIYIDMEKAIKDGIEFYVSKNGVILSPGNQDGIIDVRYFKDVVEF